MTLDSAFILRLLYALAVAAGISCLVTPLVKLLARKVGAMDIPKDNRRMHSKPIPRMGGLGIFLGFLVSFLIFGDLNTELRGILIGAIIIVILGIVDDIKALPALPKFLVQIIAASVVACHGCRIENVMGWHVPQWLSYCATVVWIVMLTNAVNFIDGLDGLAAGVSAISAGSMLVVALMLYPEPNATLSALILAAIFGGCIGFIPYNFNPASIFMGDTGSTFLGFMLASVSIFGLFKTYAVISFAVPFVVLGLPLFDICFAVIRRLAKGQSPMHADRGHVHHRLIDMGFSQKQAVIISYMITVILGICAVVLTDKGEIQALIFFVALVLVGIVGLQLFFIKNHHNKHEEENKNDEED